MYVNENVRKKKILEVKLMGVYFQIHYDLNNLLSNTTKSE